MVNEENIEAGAEQVTEEKEPVAVEEQKEEGTEPEQEAEKEPENKEAAEDADEDEPAGEQEVATKPVGRAQARIQKLASELKAEREERDRLVSDRAIAQAQLENLRQQQQAMQSASEKRAEEERLALLAPEERAMYQASQQIKSLEHRINQMEAKRADDRDRAEFHAKAAHDETYAKYAGDVEKLYQDGLSRGVSAAREELLAWVLGKELLKNKASVPQKKAAAGKRIESVTSKSSSARGDVSGSKQGKTGEDRLRGVLI